MNVGWSPSGDDSMRPEHDGWVDTDPIMHPNCRCILLPVKLNPDYPPLGLRWRACVDMVLDRQDLSPQERARVLEGWARWNVEE